MFYLGGFLPDFALISAFCAIYSIIKIIHEKMIPMGKGSVSLMLAKHFDEISRQFGPLAPSRGNLGFQGPRVSCMFHSYLGGGFKYFLEFSPLFGEDF